MDSAMTMEEFVFKCKEDIVYFAENMIRSEDGGFYTLEDHQRAMVTSKESQVVYFCGRRLGKSFMLAIECIHRALFNPYQRIFVLSPTETQAKELAETISGMIDRSAVIERDLITNNVMEKKFKNGSRIVIRTGGGKGNVSSVIGSGANLLIIDEMQDVEDGIINKIIPVMRGQKGDSKFIVAGTPRAKVGFLFESLENAPKIWNNGVWEEYPENDGNFIVYKKQTAYLNKDDEIVASGTPRITIEELKQDYKNIGPIDFKQEYCLEFMSSVTDVYPLELQQKVLYEDGLEDRFKSNKLCVYGVDFGQTRNNTVIYVAEVGDEKEIQERTLNVKYKKEFDLGIEYGKIEDYIVEELPKRFPNLRRGIFDATGVGKSVYENVKRRVKKSPRPYPIEDFYFSEKTKTELVEFGISMMTQDRVKVKWSKRLQEEMTGYKRERSQHDSNKFKYSKGSGSDDYVDAMNLCILNMSPEYGLNFKPPIVVQKIAKTMTKQFGDKKWQRSNQRPKRYSKKIMNTPRRRL